MADFAPPPLAREQIVLFAHGSTRSSPPTTASAWSTRSSAALGWGEWERRCHRRRGQPPIHPRVVAGVILYGVVCRIRTSRALEEALLVRNDFRWLVEGRTIDHTTISEFRRTNSEPLKKLFVQIALVAAQMGRLPLKTLGSGGTRLRADNRKGGTRTPEELRQAKAELEAKFAELEAKTAAADAARLKWK